MSEILEILLNLIFGAMEILGEACIPDSKAGRIWLASIVLSLLALSIWLELR